jgi:hypothetical protein
MLEALAWAPLQAKAEEVAATMRAIAAMAAQVRVIMEPPVQQTLARAKRDRKAGLVQATRSRAAWSGAGGEMTFA